MGTQLLGPVDLGTLEPLVAAGGVVGSVLWLALAAFVYAWRSPPRPDAGPRTLDLGPEPPALATFLVNDFRVTAEAVPATVLDLAARRFAEVEQRGQGVFWVRVPEGTEDGLAPYETRVLRHLRGVAAGGVVPAAALTTGPDGASKEWHGAFRAEVVADAQARGLAREALDGPVWAVLIGVAAIPAACLWAVWGILPAAAAIALAGGLLGWMTSRHPQRETPAGLEAAARWLGVREELATNDVFETYSPLTVPLWDRLLAYGAALGVAHGASSPLPLGAESDTRAWSAYGGSWREVRISYPRTWPPSWGAEPTSAVATGVALAAGAFMLFYALGGGSFVDEGAAATVQAILIAGVGVVGVVGALAGASDWGTSVEVTGPILRLRTFGDDEKRRHYVAVDDGVSPVIRAFRVSREQYAGLRQGEVVTVRATPRLGRVRWIVRGSDASTLGAP
jgi:hypothetical protein